MEFQNRCFLVSNEVDLKKEEWWLYQLKINLDPHLLTAFTGLCSALCRKGLHTVCSCLVPPLAVQLYGDQVVKPFKMTQQIQSTD